MQLLGAYLGLIQEDASEVASWSREAGCITRSDGITLVIIANDRQGRRRSARSAYRVWALSEDHPDADANHLGGEFLQSILRVRAAEFDDEILTFVVSKLR